jgi:hypothetical protein
MLSRVSIATSIVTTLLAISAPAQTKSGMGKLPEAPPNRVEVRFAVDKKAVTCDQLSVKVKQADQFLSMAASLQDSIFHRACRKIPNPRLM